MSALPAPERAAREQVSVDDRLAQITAALADGPLTRTQLARRVGGGYSGPLGRALAAGLESGVLVKERAGQAVAYSLRGKSDPPGR